MSKRGDKYLIYGMLGGVAFMVISSYSWNKYKAWKAAKAVKTEGEGGNAKSAVYSGGGSVPDEPTVTDTTQTSNTTVNNTPPSVPTVTPQIKPANITPTPLIAPAPLLPRPKTYTSTNVDGGYSEAAFFRQTLENMI